MAQPRDEEILEFMHHVREGDLDAVERLGREDPSLLDSKDPNAFGAIPLRHAVESSDYAMVDLLLALGADINGQSNWWAGGFRLLPCADEEMAEYLLTRGYRLDAWGAAGMGWMERLRTILNQDPRQANMRGGDGQTPLHVAKTIDVLDLLIDRGAELDVCDVDHGSTAAQYQINSPELCRRLVERGARPDIFIACRLGSLRLAKRILEKDPTALDARIGQPPFIAPNSQGGHIYIYHLGYTTRPLTMAAREGQTVLLEFLLDKADPRQLLVFHCWEAHESEARALLAANPRLLGQAPARDLMLLSDAAWEGRLDGVQLMLQCGFPVDAPGADGSTALDRAAFHGFSDIVEVLLRNGASTEVKNDYGGTPLGSCVHGAHHSWRSDGNHLACAQLLVAAGARVPSPWAPCGLQELDDFFTRQTVFGATGESPVS